MYNLCPAVRFEGSSVDGSTAPSPPPGPPSKTAPKFTWVLEANPSGTEGFLRHFRGPVNPPKCASSARTVLKTSLRGPSGPQHCFLEVGGYRKTSNLRNGPPMMLMMLAHVACIISIIGLRFTYLKVSGCSHCVLSCVL